MPLVADYPHCSVITSLVRSGHWKRSESLTSLRERLKWIIPRPVWQVLKSIYCPSYRWLLRTCCWYADRYGYPRQTQGAIAYLPALLRFRVSGSISADLFGSVGQRASQNLQSALAQVGSGIEPDQSVLDFGSGCGRTLLWLLHDFPKTRFYGTDVDPEAVEWCCRNLTNAEFQVNSPLPPMLYHDEQFDLVYLISVFTHLSDEYQEVWPSRIAPRNSSGRHSAADCARRGSLEAPPSSKAETTNE